MRNAVLSKQAWVQTSQATGSSN